METRQISFSYRLVTMAKIFEELFTPILNELAVSVWYMSSTQVVLHSGLTNQSWHSKISLNNKKLKKSNTVTLFLKWNKKSSCSLDYACINNYYICYKNLCKSIEKYI